MSVVNIGECRNCQRLVISGDNRCPHCGTKLLIVRENIDEKFAEWILALPF